MNEIKSESSKVYEDLMNEVQQEIALDNEFCKSAYKSEIAKKQSMFNRVFEKMFGKLLTKLQIKITILWNGKEVFSYVIPKD